MSLYIYNIYLYICVYIYILSSLFMAENAQILIYYVICSFAVLEHCLCNRLCSLQSGDVHGCILSTEGDRCGTS